MSKKNDGGPAFPTPAREHAQGYDGMTMRDWLAGQALPALINCAYEVFIRAGYGGNERAKKLATETYTETAIAAGAYAMADAMLEARKK